MAVEHPRVSIVIPTYNRGPMLKDCIGSVVREAGDFEILVIDNASQDNTRDVVHSFNDGRIRYERFDELVDIWGNHNRAIDLATGDFIAFLHSDDTFYSYGHLLKVFDLIPEAEFIAKPARVGQDEPKSARRLEFYEVFANNVRGKSPTTPCGMLYSRRLLRELGGLRPKSMTADWEILIRACQKKLPLYVFDGGFISKNTWEANYTTTLSRTGQSHVTHAQFVSQFLDELTDHEEFFTGYVRECQIVQIMALYRLLHHSDRVKEAALLKRIALKAGRWDRTSSEFLHAVLDQALGLNLYLKTFRMAKRLELLARGMMPHKR